MISDRTIAEVKARVDLVALVSEHVPSLKVRGRSHVGLCPFHNEKSPSFTVNRERGWFYCFGCKESGTAIDFLMKLEGHTFREAVLDLAERAGVVVDEDESPEERRRFNERRQEQNQLYQVMNLAAQFYERQLAEHPSRRLAREALEQRELDVEQPAVREVLSAFRVGYASAAWNDLAVYLRDQGISPIDGERAGLLVPRASGGHYDRFRHRLMFAVVDLHGRVVAFSGRALAPLPEDAEREQPAKYINSPETPIYTKGAELFGLYQARQAIRQGASALLVEGNFDVVGLHARGIGHAVAPLGTAFTPEQAKLLRRFCADATLLFDSDRAGQKATMAAREPLRQAGLGAKVASLPAGHDPDSFVRELGEAKLKEAIASARGLREVLLERALSESFSQADIQEKMRRIDQVLQLLGEEDDPLVRATLKTFADQLAGRLDIHGQEPFRALEQKVKRAFAQERATASGPTPRDARVRRKPRGSQERAAIVGALLDFPELLHDPEIEDALPLLEGTASVVVTALARIQIAGKIPEAGSFLQELPQETREFVAGRLAHPEHPSREEAKRALLTSKEQLKRRLSSDEHVEMVKQQRRSDGDLTAQFELARQAADQQRRSRGIK